MAFKWNPGCECCNPEGCQAVTIGYTPTSSQGRGEWDDTPDWEPLIAYTIGERFLHPRLIDGRPTAWEVPQDLQSGPTWNAFEESRYIELLAIDTIDEVEQWDFIGDGWAALTPSVREDAIINGYLYEDCGFRSRDDVMPTTSLDWWVQFYFDVNPVPPDINYRISARVATSNTPIPGDVTLDVTRIPASESPPAPQPPLYYDPFEYIAHLKRTGVTQDTTWYNNSPPEHWLAHTKQPLTAQIIGSLNATTGDTNWQMVPFWSPNFLYVAGTRFIQRATFGNGLFVYEAFEDVLSGMSWDVFEEQRYTRINPGIKEYHVSSVANSFDNSAFKVIGGPGIFYGDGYDFDDPDTYIIINDGDLLIKRYNPTDNEADLAYVEHVLAADVVQEFLLMGGGMETESPGDIPTGRKIEVYVERLQFESNEQGQWGLKLSFAETQRTRTYDEPTCRIVDATACPCPLVTEYYPAPCETGINDDFDALHVLYTALPLAPLFPDEPLGLTPGGDPVFMEYDREGLLCDVGIVCVRTGLCSYEWYKLSAYETIWKHDAYRTYFGVAVPAGYIQHIFIGLERVTAGWSPSRGRFVRVRSTASIAFALYYSLIVPQSDPSGFKTCGELREEFEAYNVLRGEWIRGTALFITGVVETEVSRDLFPCNGGWTLTGYYNISPVEYQPNPLTGYEWRVTV